MVKVDSIGVFMLVVIIIFMVEDLVELMVKLKINFINFVVFEFLAVNFKFMCCFMGLDFKFVTVIILVVRAFIDEFDEFGKYGFNFKYFIMVVIQFFVIKFNFNVIVEHLIIVLV